ncbi:uroporphyrinogen decarboxylase family protein [Cypionkella sp.]|uniref:uroporphyrinogen decarboxylase family protein n=1 Tax=Cypionkella sp. TaxID=2811411 RepID=UPI002AB8FC57|nr:uroporphyrinogen decarboxylase family protein [Cypionkella sp.]MDZ4395906.1 uroporphyrinogen decarboxylase family protein [Cypionkella sp.]
MPYSDAIKTVFVDRLGKGPLFSVWSHFPEVDMEAERLAEASVAFQRDFDLDFLKTAPNGMYAVEDMGVQVDFSEVARGGVARIVDTPFERPEDWARLPLVDPETGALGRELHALRLMRAALPKVPIIFTIFSPMTIAAKLSRGAVHRQIAEKQGLAGLHEALERIAANVRLYAKAAIAAGADGVFFAHQDSGRNVLGYDDFCEFVAPYDLEALVGAQQGKFNILHAHGAQIRFRDIRDYPVHALNWHNWETRPSAAAAMISSDKCIVGGIDRRAMTGNDVELVKAQIMQTLQEVQGLGGDLIIAPSCSIRAGLSRDTLHAVRDFVRALPEFAPDAAEAAA